MVADDLKENIPLQKEAKVSMAPTDMKPGPEFIQKRIEMWDRLMAEYKAEIAQKLEELMPNPCDRPNRRHDEDDAFAESEPKKRRRRGRRRSEGTSGNMSSTLTGGWFPRRR